MNLRNCLPRKIAIYAILQYISIYVFEKVCKINCSLLQF